MKATEVGRFVARRVPHPRSSRTPEKVRGWKWISRLIGPISASRVSEFCGLWGNK